VTHTDKDWTKHGGDLKEESLKERGNKTMMYINQEVGGKDEGSVQRLKRESICGWWGVLKEKGKA